MSSLIKQKQKNKKKKERKERRRKEKKGGKKGRGKKGGGMKERKGGKKETKLRNYATWSYSNDARKKNAAFALWSLNTRSVLRPLPNSLFDLPASAQPKVDNPSPHKASCDSLAPRNIMHACLLMVTRFARAHNGTCA